MKTVQFTLQLTSKPFARFILMLLIILAVSSCRKENYEAPYDCSHIQSPNISIISEDGKRYLCMTDFTNWITIFENVNNIEVRKCSVLLDFNKHIYKNIKVLVITSTLYNYSFAPVTIKIELAKNKNEANIENGKIYLEKNSRYGIYVIPMGHSGPVYFFTYDGQNVRFVD